MRTFYSPAERRLLDSLPPNEREVVETLMQECDASLVDDEDPATVEPQTTLDDIAA